MGETQTLLLQIAADTSGFVALEKRFLDLTTTLEGAASRINKSLGTGSKSSAAGLAEMQSKLEQANAALRTQGAEIEALTAKMERQSSTRKKINKDFDDASEHVKAYSAALKEQASVAETTAARQMQMDKLRSDRMRINYKEDMGVIEANNSLTLRLIKEQQAAYSKAEAEKTATMNEMSKLRQKRAIEEASAMIAAKKAENADSLKLLNMSVGAAASAEAAAAQGKLRQSMAATRAEASLLREEQRALHDATRGLAGGVGALWMTYGQLIPLMAGFAISASIASAVKTGAEFQMQLAYIAAAGEFTTEKVNIAGESFKQLSLNSQYSANEIAKGALVMVQAGFSMEESVKTLPQILKFASLGQIELGQAVEIAAGNMHAFGLTIEDLPHILDSTAKASAISQTNIHEMGQALRQASTVAQQFGVTIDEMNALLAVAADRNIRGSAAGTALRNMMTELDPKTAKAAKAFKELGIEVYDANNKFKATIPLLREFAAKFAEYDDKSRNRLAGGIFSERGIKEFMVAIANGGVRLDELFKQIQNSQGYVDQGAKKINDTVEVQGKQAWHAFQKAFLDAFDAGSGSLMEFLKLLKEGFESESFKNFARNLITGFFGLIEVITKAMPLIEGFVASTLFIGGGAIILKTATAFDALRLSIIASSDAAVLGAAKTEAAIAGTEAAALASKATVLGSVGKLGLLGFITFGGYEIGSLIYDIEYVGTTVASVVDKMVNKAKENKGILTALGLLLNPGAAASVIATAGGPNINYDPNAGNSRTGLIRKVGPDINSADAYEGVIGGLPKQIGPKKTWTPTDNKAALAQLSEDVANWKASIAEEKALFSERNESMKMSFKEGLQNEGQYYSSSNRLLNEHLAVVTQFHDMEIADLQKALLMHGLEPQERSRINKQIIAADLELYKETSKMNKLRAQEIGQMVKPLLDFGKKEIEQSEHAIAKIQEEVDQLLIFNPIKKDAALREMEYAAAKEKSNLARMEAITLGFKDNDFLNAEEIAILNAVAAMRKQATTMDELIVKYKNLSAQRLALKDDWASGAMTGLEEYIKAVGTVADQTKKLFADAFGGLEKALTNFVMTGKLDFKDMLKSWAADIVKFVIQQQITKPLANWLGGALQSMLGGGGGFSGGGGGGGFGGFGGGTTNYTGLMSAASNWFGGGAKGGADAWAGGGWGGADTVYSGTSSGAGSMAGGLAGVAGAAFSGYAIGTGLNSLIGNQRNKTGMQAGATAGAAIGSVIPVIGTVIGAVIGAILGSFIKSGGGSKVGGSYQGVFDTTGKLVSSDSTPLFGLKPKEATGSDEVKKLADATILSYYTITSRLGGTAKALSFGLGYDSDPLGTADNRVMASLKDSNGNVLYSEKDRGIGRDNSKIGEQLGLTAQRALLAGLQQSNMPKYIADILMSVSSATGTSEEIANVLDQAVRVADVVKKLEKQGIKGFTPENVMQMAINGETAAQTFERFSTGFNNITNVFTTDSDRVWGAAEDLNKAFGTLGMKMPANIADWKTLAGTIDLSTEAGRSLFQVMSDSGPVFAQYQEYIKNINKSFDDAASSYGGGQVGKDIKKQNLNDTIHRWNMLTNGGTYSDSQTLTDLGGIHSLAQINAIRTYASQFNGGLELATLMLSQFTDTLEESTYGTEAWTAANIAAGYIHAPPTELDNAKSGLATYLRGSRVADTSPLSITEKYLQSKQELTRLTALAQGGNIDAINGLGGARDTFLGFSRQVNGSNGQYNNDWFSTFDTLNAITGGAVSRPVNAADMVANTQKLATAIADVVVSQQETRAAIAALAAVVTETATQGDVVLQGKTDEEIVVLTKIANAGGTVSSTNKGLN